MMSGSGCIKVGKFNFRYSIEGMGQPILIIGSATYYSRIFSKELRKHAQLIFIDHRGFAEPIAPLTAADHQLDAVIHDIEAIRNHLGMEKCIILGHSGHAYMALEYAKQYPQVVSRLILLAFSPNSNDKSYAAADRYFQESVCPTRKALLARNLGSLEKEITNDPKRAFIIRLLAFGPMLWFDENFDAAILWEDVNVVPEIMDHLWGKVFRELDITKNMEKLIMPIFLGLGRYDYFNPPYLWEEVRSLFNNITVRVFEKSGHTPPYEEPDLFNQELLAWLNIK